MKPPCCGHSGAGPAPSSLREACNISKEKEFLLAGVGSSPVIHMIQYDLGVTCSRWEQQNPVTSKVESNMSIIYSYLFSFLVYSIANWQLLIMWCWELGGRGAHMPILGRVKGSRSTFGCWRHGFQWCDRSHRSSAPAPYQGGSSDLLSDPGQLPLLKWRFHSLLLLGQSGAVAVSKW